MHGDLALLIKVFSLNLNLYISNDYNSGGEKCGLLCAQLVGPRIGVNSSRVSAPTCWSFLWFKVVTFSVSPLN